MLSTPPILALPKEREKLYLYVAARSSVVSTALVVERAEEGKVQSIQRPIYYLSMLLTKSQQRYPHYQKLLLAIIMTSRKLSHYFDEHPINRAQPTRPAVQAPNNNQGPSTRRLSSRLDRGPNTRPPGPIELMDNVFRRVQNIARS